MDAEEKPSQPDNNNEQVVVNHFTIFHFVALSIK